MHTAFLHKRANNKATQKRQIRADFYVCGVLHFTTKALDAYMMRAVETFCADNNVRIGAANVRIGAARARYSIIVSMQWSSAFLSVTYTKRFTTKNDHSEHDF